MCRCGWKGWGSDRVSRRIALDGSLCPADLEIVRVERGIEVLRFAPAVAGHVILSERSEAKNLLSGSKETPTPCCPAKRVRPACIGRSSALQESACACMRRARRSARARRSVRAACSNDAVTPKRFEHE